MKDLCSIAPFGSFLVVVGGSLSRPVSSDVTPRGTQAWLICFGTRLVGDYFYSASGSFVVSFGHERTSLKIMPNVSHVGQVTSGVHGVSLFFLMVMLNYAAGSVIWSSHFAL